MLNKNISVWRGSLPPPTNYHLWLDGTHIKEFQNGKWVSINQLPKDLLGVLYQARLDLTLYENIQGIYVEDAEFFENSYKLKGTITIPIPHLGTYNVLIRCSEPTEAKVVTTKEYSIGDVVSLKFIEVSNITFTFTDYVKVKEIIVLEVADLNSIDLYLDPSEEDNKFYIRYNNTWKEINLLGDLKLNTDGNIVLDKTDLIEEDNKKVITSGGVYNVVGDIQQCLLKI